MFSSYVKCMISFYIHWKQKMPNAIQERLNEARLARGMTPAELGRAIGVGNGYVSKLLAGYIS
ncbi:helix-turn-helix domain-containing protein, partial [Serratia ureilytica]|uniref:helix-turn-helix domain-containing protein n=1 Tax=Serratia ureilytica TaxID=300181 RepID=UPI0034C5EB43